MQSKLEGTTGNNQVEADQDNIALFTMIKKIVCGVEESLQKIKAIVMAEKTLHTFCKKSNVANDNYKSQFDVYVTVLETYAGGIIVPLALVDGNLRELYPSLSDPNNALSRQHEAETESTKE